MADAGLRPGGGGSPEAQTWFDPPLPHHCQGRPQGPILTEAAARWLYGRVPFRDVSSTAAEQVMKAVM